MRGSADKEEVYDPTEDMGTETMPKTEEERSRILTALKKTEIFAHCTNEQYEFLISQATSVGVEVGEPVIQQGESGDHFYIVHSGVFVVRACPTPPPPHLLSLILSF